MLLKILLKTLMTKIHDFNHNKCHACVQNGIPPYIYVRTKSFNRRKKHKRKSVENSKKEEEQSIEKEVKLKTAAIISTQIRESKTKRK